MQSEVYEGRKPNLQLVVSTIQKLVCNFIIP